MRVYLLRTLYMRGNYYCGTVATELLALNMMTGELGSWKGEPNPRRRSFPPRVRREVALCDSAIIGEESRTNLCGVIGVVVIVFLL